MRSAIAFVAVLDDVANVDAGEGNSMRLFSGSEPSRSTTPCCTAAAHSTASNRARELDQRAVAHQLDDANVVLGDQRLDELLKQRLQARQRANLVGPTRRL